MIAWTIERALKSKLINRYVVSTEDDDIAAIAKDLGSEILTRPAHLAGDKVATLDVLQHAVKSIPCDIVVLLQATSPIRSSGLIDSCIETFLKKRPHSLATGFMCKFEEYGKCVNPRQDINGFFYDDGNVYVIDAGLILQGDRYGDNIERVILDRESNVEIDDSFDFWLAEQILLKNQLTDK